MLVVSHGPYRRNRASLFVAGSFVIMAITRSGAGSASGQSRLTTTASALSSASRKKTYQGKKHPSAKEAPPLTAASTGRTGRKKTVTSSSGAKIEVASSDPRTATSNDDILFALSDDVVMGELRKRPSKRNKSPYVGDVWLENEQREAIVHLPNLDMGGKCVPGAKLVLKPARDKKGNLVGKDAVNPKYGTPKCEFIAQLLRVDESGLSSIYEPAWVGAHPSLGEKIAERLVSRNLLGTKFPKVQSFKREVSNVGGTDMRADFLIQHEDPSLPPRILEVKTVVDTDYSTTAVPDRDKCVFTSDKEPYTRTGIFPWGNGNQKGPEGEPVVSARAIKHVRELTRMVQERPQRFDATILFVVIRHDAKAFRPNKDACPSFARYLKEAEEAGVQVLAKQVRWGEEDAQAGATGGSLQLVGKCYEGDLLDVVWP